MSSLHRCSVFLLGLAALPLPAAADTIPCSHRFAATKARETFDFIQQKPEVNTGTKATSLVEARETRQERLAEFDMLVRYCDGVLVLDNGARVAVQFRLGSRETYKRERAEDFQICWRDRRYGQIATPDRSLGC